MTTSPPLPRKRYIGIPASPGLARGPILVGADVFEEPELRQITLAGIPAELARLAEGLKRTREQILRLQERMSKEAGEDSAAIFDAHLLMLEDGDLLRRVHKRIESSGENAEHAYWASMQQYANVLRNFEDEYLRERTTDLEDVAQRVVRNLTGCTNTSHGEHPHILFVHELTPSAAAALDRKKVLALITEVGSQTSHAAIIARSMGIPAVAGVHELSLHFPTGTECLVDGSRGEIILEPELADLAHYEEGLKKQALRLAKLDGISHEVSRTRDGVRLHLEANIEFTKEIPAASLAGAEGVGLYRTEFFYLNRQGLPTEDEQYENYRQAAEATAPHRVIIRTMDIGGDKIHDLHRNLDESNPFLGWRGIRVSLTQPGIFKTQLRAVLRASAHGRLSLMFPMISGNAELRAAKAVLRECREELMAEGVPFDTALPVGCMIEIPSAAIMARQLAQEVDFFSIGTNDLIQYTIAVDRENEHVADLYQPSHPAIIFLLKSVSEAARQAGIPCGICGELAADLNLLPLLVGLGFKELSMAAVQIPTVKYAVRSLDAARCRDLVQDVLQLTDPAVIYDRVRETALEFYPELFS